MKRMRSKAQQYSQWLSKILYFWVLNLTSLLALNPPDQSTASLGTGGAYSSIADDESAFLLNPAGTSRQIGKRQIFVENHFLNQFKKWNLKTGFIDAVSEAPLTFGFLFSTYNTKERKRDDYILSTGYNWENLILVAVNHHFVRFRQAAQTNPKWAFEIDAGILAFPTDYLALGVSYKSAYRTIQNNLELPRLLIGGLSINLKKARLAVDFEKNFSMGTDEIRVGSEYRLSSFSIIRLGYFTDREGSQKGYTTGCQLLTGDTFATDFGFVDYLNSDIFIYSIGGRMSF